MQELKLYSRQGCHLCDEMLDALELFKSELGYKINVSDIDQDEQLYARFNTQVPVVCLDNKELMRYHFSLATLKAALSKG